MMNYSVIEIFTSEDTRWHGKPLPDAILAFVGGLKIAARVIVARGVSGCYENGETATNKVEILSFKMPLKIEIVLPALEVDRVLPAVQEMVGDGIVGVRDLTSVSHKTQRHLIPRHLRIRDLMTAAVTTVSGTTPVSDVVRILLSADFNGVPVVDSLGKPIGIITQGDLIARGGMPIRLGLLELLGRENLDTVFAAMTGKTAAGIMTQPVVTISEDQPLTAAVDVMIAKDLKRLPVINAEGRLSGMLARLDVFRTITTETPDWNVLQARNVLVTNLCLVKDVMRRDAHQVSADATLDEVMRIIDSNDIQRVAVVDGDNKLLGLISDHDLLGLFSDHKVGIWDRIASKLTFTDMGKRHLAVVEQARKRTATEIMKTNLVTIREEAPIEEAIRLMTENQIKRLPVTDVEGKLLGVVSRDSLLRAGMSASGQ
jgi:CBS domain-containing protein